MNGHAVSCISADRLDEVSIESMTEASPTTGLFKALAIIALAVGGLAATLEPAAAQSNYCARLQADYQSALRSGGGGGGNTASLRKQLASAEREASRKKCRRIFGRSRDCRAVNAKVNRLRQKLSQASRGGSRGASTAQRNRLRSQLRRNGCEVPNSGGVQWAGSGYRTLCVRTCDGFYFPISFRSSRSRFKIDETVCKAMYGGAGAELYYHHNGSSPDRAVSLKGGRPLAAEPYAFAYRRTFSESCQGELKRGLANLANAFEARVAAKGPDKPAASESATTRLMPIPVARANPAIDPETVANLTGEFVPGRIIPEGAQDVVVAEVRKLGDDYYYTLPETIAAIYEAPDPGPEFTLFSEARADERANVSDAPAGQTTVQ